MGSAFKLQPEAIDKLEFKNGVGQVVATIVKRDNGKIVFVPKFSNFVLNEKEQYLLVDFLLGHM